MTQTMTQTPMNQAPPFDDTVANTSFDTAIEALMAVMLLFLPLAFGTTEAWSQAAWTALVAAMGVCLLAKRVTYRGCPAVWSWAYVPIVLFLLLCVVQQVPLPRGVMTAISPSTASLKDELLGAQAASLTLSFYAFATAHQTRLVACAATLFVVVLHAYRSPARVRRLLITVTVAGLAVAAVAAYGDLTRATLIYGTVPVGHKNSGPFQNYSHFSQFMNLSVGGAVALLLLSAFEWGGSRFDRRAVWDEARRPRNAFIWVAVVVVVMGPVLIFWSMSRMGMISMLIAGGVMAGLLGWRASRGRSGAAGPGGTFLVLCLGVAVVAVLLAIGFEAIYDRLATVRNIETTSGGRGQILRDIADIVARFPLWGTGLGTHEFVFPMFSHQDHNRLVTHAENEYAQLIEETGVAGGLLAGAFLAIVMAAFFRAVWSPRRPAQFAAFGLGFGLVAILIHSFSDFGQHVPANATLTAIFCALLINTAATVRPAVPVPAMATSWLTPVVRGGVLATFVLAAGWIMWRAETFRRAEAASTQAKALAVPLEQLGWAGDDEQYRQLLTAAATAADTEPTNVAYRHWLTAYRWQAVSRDAVDPDTRQLTFYPETIAFARQLVDDFDAVRALCPTFGPPLCVAGQIRSQVLGDPAGDEQVRTAFRLAPYDRTVCYMNGVLATRRQDWETARVALDRYVTLGGPRWQVVDIYLLARRPDLAYAAAAGDRANLQRLGAGLASGWPAEAALAARCAADVERLLIEESEKDGANPQLWAERGRLENSRGRPAEAAVWLQKAVDSDYGRVDWRMTLARTLGDAGKRDEAVRHLRICLRLRPNLQEAEALIAQYSSGRSDGRDVR